MMMVAAVVNKMLNMIDSDPGNDVDVLRPVVAVQVLQVPVVHRHHLHHHLIPVLAPRDQVHSLGLDPHRDLESRPRNEERGNVPSLVLQK